MSPTLHYEFHDGSDGSVILENDGDALDFITETERNGPDFYIKSAWIDDVPYIGECTRNHDGSLMENGK